jgi:hypothetical protein
MRRLALFLCVAVVALAFSALASAASQNNIYEVYTAKVNRDQAREIARGGYDIATIRGTEAGIEIDLVLSDVERGRLESQGVDLSLKRLKNGQTIQEFAAAQSEFGFNVWRSFDEPGGIRDELYNIARRNPGIVKLQVLGRSVQGREIIALKVTKDARKVTDGARPGALYVSLQHAREWISVEVNRRLLHRFVDNYGKNTEITNLVNTRELWFVVVANPDGYQFTFTDERLWRKNLRDNNGDGQIALGDGVDPNRNWPEHWNYDEEGSAGLVSDETYRGTAPASEPETQALKGLLDRLKGKAKFMINWHSAADQVLLPYGWQESTPSPDNPIFVALAGTDANPSIPGYDIGLSSDELYITNGETTDYAYSEDGILAVTPELSEGCDGCGFVFPDDETLIQEQFERTLQFSMNVARSVTRITNPVSHLGVTLAPFYTHQDQLDPQVSNMPLTDFRFQYSYGSPQPVRILARKDLGAVELKYKVSGGAVQTKSTAAWAGGDRYGDVDGVYYHILEGVVTGAQPGQKVEVWFQDADGPSTSESFEYTVVSDTDRDVLVVAAEDYTGISPVYKSNPRPAFLQYYLDALRANGIEPDVYDVDARGRIAPDELGVLSHYRAVVWYTGNDIITREPGMRPGTASRLAQDNMLNVRSYLNEGGRLFWTGKFAGFSNAFGFEFDPLFNRPCDGILFNREFGADQEGCRDQFDDFLQYYLGAYIYADEGGTTSKGTLHDVNGTDTPFASLSWSFGAPSANNQDHSASFLPTSTFLPATDYPQFRSWRSARWDKVGGPFEPHTGEFYMHSRIADVSYKRITRTIDLTGQSSGELSFWTSYDTEVDWDFVFVEAHAVGSDAWTTLPDLNGHTGTSTGESCPEGWHELHPWLVRYQGEDCSGVGTTGTWNAASGTSSGWQQWRVDLTPYAGKQVEVSIAYASDWAVQGLGTFVDDIVVSTGEGTTSFEAGLDGWAVTGPPEGSGPNANNFERITAAGFPEAAVVTSQPADGATFRTLYAGFGLEGISGPTARANVMGRAMAYLLE